VPKIVQGVSAKDEMSRNMRTSRISIQAGERRRTKGARPESGGGNGRSRGKNVEAKRLTVRMKEAKSAEEFVNVLEPAVDLPIFNYFHASASYHRLAMWKRMGKLPAGDKTNLLLDRLNRRVKGMVAENKVNPQACANILWSVAHLSDALTKALDVVTEIAAQIAVKALL